MESTNPYKSPSAEGSSESKHDPHGKSVRQEAWRGAKFGSKITGGTFGVFMVIAWAYMACLGAFRWSSTGVSPLDQIGGPFELAKSVGESIFVVALVSFYAAITGAIVMTLAALVKKMRR